MDEAADPSLSTPRWQGSSNLRSGKSAFFGLGPQAALMQNCRSFVQAGSNAVSLNCLSVCDKGYRL
jgi:hypothetical protein